MNNTPLTHKVTINSTALQSAGAAAIASTAIGSTKTAGKPVLLRHVIGDQLRQRRQSQQRTLREVSRSAQVSLGYLSEVERGQKEASSELLASICAALDASLSDLLIDVSAEVARREAKFETLVPIN